MASDDFPIELLQTTNERKLICIIVNIGITIQQHFI